MTAEDIRTKARQYNKVSLWLVVALTMVGLVYVQVTYSYGLIYSLVFSSLYSLVTCWIYGAAWKRIALNSPDSLNLFYLAGSGLRMVLGLIVVLVGMFLLRDNRGQLLGFTAVFVLFYLAILLFDSVFFVRIAKSNSSTKS